MIAWVALIALVIAAPFGVEAFRSPMSEEVRAGAPGRFATLSQGTTHYRWIGPTRGPIAVCVHGLTTPSFVWEGIARRLSEAGYRVLIYDLYGRGYSDRPPGRQNRDFFLRQLDDLLGNQGIEDDFTLIGYSMGGAIATAFAEANPGRLRQLILIAPAGIRIAVSPTMRIVRDIPLLGDWLALTFFPHSHRKATEAERALPSAVPNIVDRQQAELQWRGYIPAVVSSLRGILAGDQQQAHRSLAQSELPVTAIWAREDRMIPIRAMGDLAQWNRTALHEVINGAGHGLPYTHTRDVVTAMLDLGR